MRIYLFFLLAFLPISVQAQWVDQGDKLITSDDIETTGDITVGKSGEAGVIKLRRGVDGNLTGVIGFNGGGSESHNLSILNSGGGGYISFLTNSGGVQERMRISGNGNVGIGTHNPLFHLDIKTHNGYEGNNLYFGDRRFYIAGMTGNGTQMYGGLILNNFGAGIRGLEVAVDHDNDFNVNKNPANYVATFLSNGNVGIGTRNPDSRLTVAGKIHAQEIKVTTTAGADFVFEADYPLRSLEETEQFITENKHLPDIPSAEEMVEEGITLGEMNVKLLQKIEELTLYQIDQNKKIAVLMQAVEALRKENENAQ